MSDESLTELLRRFNGQQLEQPGSRAERWPDSPIPAFLEPDGKVRYRKVDKPAVVDLSQPRQRGRNLP